jgi:outer membrane receptor protein involved in Fe transport
VIARGAFAVVLLAAAAAGPAYAQGTPAAGPEGDEAPPVLTPADLDSEVDVEGEGGLLPLTQYSLDALKDIDLGKLLEGGAAVASLTGSRAVGIPASITTITDQDIRLTPARNIYDLLEVYVPGASWVIHSEGPHPGIRGIISDRNYKFLLLVNGRLMNQKAHGGAVTELENWELSDIAQIDILRGPGSVTYGPGAIAGVVSITTKNARRYRGNALRAGFVAPYTSFATAGETVFENDRFAVYAYASRVATQGIGGKGGAGGARHFATDVSNRGGYLGETPAFPDGPAVYFGDYSGVPQLKAHLDVRFLRHWTVWARFTSCGSSAGTTMGGMANQAERLQTGFTPAGDAILGPPYTRKQLQSRQLTLTVTNEHRLGRRVALKTMASVDSLDWRRRLQDVRPFSPDTPDVVRNALTDPDNLRFYAQRFAEHELFARLLANLNLHERLRGAVGAEWSYDRWGPGWGDSARSFRMGDSNNIISGTDSQAYDWHRYGGVDPTRVWVETDGFGQHTGSLLGEIDARLHPRLSLWLSARADQSSRADLLLSPRIAIVSRLGEHQVAKLIWQRAKRLNTAEQRYYQRKVSGTRADPEVLTGYEGSYSLLPINGFSLSFTGFYNTVQVIGWNVSQAQSLAAGRLRLAGAEAEAVYSRGRLRLGINHSVVKQRSWRLGNGVTQSGVSYADYNQMTDPAERPVLLIRGAGNDLNNWSTHASKLYLHARVADWLAVHVDARVFWGYPGAKDGLRALERAAAGTDHEEPVAGSLALLRHEGAYGVDLRANAAVDVALSSSLALTAYAMNIVGIGGNKLYAYDAGNVRAAPVRSQFVREPFTAGARATYSW